MGPQGRVFQIYAGAEHGGRAGQYHRAYVFIARKLGGGSYQCVHGRQVQCIGLAATVETHHRHAIVTLD
ncbi:hypothetical protein D3C73_1194910 [compost metagenome]